MNNYLTVAAIAEPYSYDPFLDDWRYTRDTTPHYGPPVRLLFKTDSEIKEEIESEFFCSPFVDGDDIKVSVNNGTATLTGTVGSWSEHSAANENAIEGGAALVNNQLDVEVK